MKVNGLETSAPLVGALCYDSAWREGEFVARSVSTDARSNAAKAPEVVDPTSAEGPIANERPSSTRIHHGGEGTVASALAFFCLISFCFGPRPPKNSAACLDAEADGVNACRCLLVVCSPPVAIVPVVVLGVLRRALARHLDCLFLFKWLDKKQNSTKVDDTVALSCSTNENKLDNSYTVVVVRTRDRKS